MTMNKKLIEAVRRHFTQRLQAKTGWGRVELLQEFEAAVNDALLELLEDGQ